MSKDLEQEKIKKNTERRIMLPEEPDCLFYAILFSTFIPALGNPQKFSQVFNRVFSGSKVKEKEFAQFLQAYIQAEYSLPDPDSAEGEKFKSIVTAFRNSLVKVRKNPAMTDEILSDTEDDGNKMSDSSAWGGIAEIAAAARLLECTIFIEGEDNPISRDSLNQNPPIFLFQVNFGTRQSHYGYVLHLSPQQSPVSTPIQPPTPQRKEEDLTDVARVLFPGTPQTKEETNEAVERVVENENDVKEELTEDQKGRLEELNFLESRGLTPKKLNKKEKIEKVKNFNEREIASDIKNSPDYNTTLGKMKGFGFNTRSLEKAVAYNSISGAIKNMKEFEKAKEIEDKIKRLELEGKLNLKKYQKEIADLLRRDVLIDKDKYKLIWLLIHLGTELFSKLPAISKDEALLRLSNTINPDNDYIELMEEEVEKRRWEDSSVLSLAIHLWREDPEKTKLTDVPSTYFLLRMLDVVRFIAMDEDIDIKEQQIFRAILSLGINSASKLFGSDEEMDNTDEIKVFVREPLESLIDKLKIRTFLFKTFDDMSGDKNLGCLLNLKFGDSTEKEQEFLDFTLKTILSKEESLDDNEKESWKRLNQSNDDELNRQEKELTNVGKKLILSLYDTCKPKEEDKLKFKKKIYSYFAPSIKNLIDLVVETLWSINKNDPDAFRNSIVGKAIFSEISGKIRNYFDSQPAVDEDFQANSIGQEEKKDFGKYIQYEANRWIDSKLENIKFTLLDPKGFSEEKEILKSLNEGLKTIADSCNTEIKNSLLREKSKKYLADVNEFFIEKFGRKVENYEAVYESLKEGDSYKLAKAFKKDDFLKIVKFNQSFLQDDLNKKEDDFLNDLDNILINDNTKKFIKEDFFINRLTEKRIRRLIYGLQCYLKDIAKDGCDVKYMDGFINKITKVVDDYFGNPDKNKALAEDVCKELRGEIKAAKQHFFALKKNDDFGEERKREINLFLKSLYDAVDGVKNPKKEKEKIRIKNMRYTRGRIDFEMEQLKKKKIVLKEETIVDIDELKEKDTSLPNTVTDEHKKIVIQIGGLVKKCDDIFDEELNVTLNEIEENGLREGKDANIVEKEMIGIAGLEEIEKYKRLKEIKAYLSTVIRRAASVLSPKEPLSGLQKYLPTTPSGYGKMLGGIGVLMVLAFLLPIGTASLIAWASAGSKYAGFAVLSATVLSLITLASEIPLVISAIFPIYKLVEPIFNPPDEKILLTELETIKTQLEFIDQKEHIVTFVDEKTALVKKEDTLKKATELQVPKAVEDMIAKKIKGAQNTIDTLALKIKDKEIEVEGKKKNILTDILKVANLNLDEALKNFNVYSFMGINFNSQKVQKPYQDITEQEKKFCIKLQSELKGHQEEIEGLRKEILRLRDETISQELRRAAGARVFRNILLQEKKLTLGMETILSTLRITQFELEAKGLLERLKKTLDGDWSNESVQSACKEFADFQLDKKIVFLREFMTLEKKKDDYQSQAIFLKRQFTKGISSEDAVQIFYSPYLTDKMALSFYFLWLEYSKNVDDEIVSLLNLDDSPTKRDILLFKSLTVFEQVNILLGFIDSPQTYFNVLDVRQKIEVYKSLFLRDEMAAELISEKMPESEKKQAKIELYVLDFLGEGFNKKAPEKISLKKGMEEYQEDLKKVPMHVLFDAVRKNSEWKDYKKVKLVENVAFKLERRAINLSFKDADSEDHSLYLVSNVPKNVFFILYSLLKDVSGDFFKENEISIEKIREGLRFKKDGFYVDFFFDPKFQEIVFCVDEEAEGYKVKLILENIFKYIEQSIANTGNKIKVSAITIKCNETKREDVKSSVEESKCFEFEKYELVKAGEADKKQVHVTIPGAEEVISFEESEVNYDGFYQLGVSRESFSELLLSFIGDFLVREKVASDIFNALKKKSVPDAFLNDPEWKDLWSKYSNEKNEDEKYKLAKLIFNYCSRETIFESYVDYIKKDIRSMLFYRRALQVYCDKVGVNVHVIKKDFHGNWSFVESCGNGGRGSKIIFNEEQLSTQDRQNNIYEIETEIKCGISQGNFVSGERAVLADSFKRIDIRGFERIIKEEGARDIFFKNGVYFYENTLHFADPIRKFRFFVKNMDIFGIVAIQKCNDRITGTLHFYPSKYTQEDAMKIIRLKMNPSVPMLLDSSSSLGAAEKSDLDKNTFLFDWLYTINIPNEPIKDEVDPVIEQIFTMGTFVCVINDIYTLKPSDLKTAEEIAFFVQDRRNEKKARDNSFKNLDENADIRRLCFYDNEDRKGDVFDLLDFMGVYSKNTGQIDWQGEARLGECYITPKLKDLYLKKEQEKYSEEAFLKLWEDIKIELREHGVPTGMELKYFLSMIQSKNFSIVFGLAGFPDIFSIKNEDKDKDKGEIYTVAEQELEIKNGVVTVKVIIKKSLWKELLHGDVGYFSYSYTFDSKGKSLISPMIFVLNGRKETLEEIKKYLHENISEGLTSKNIYEDTKEAISSDQYEKYEKKIEKFEDEKYLDFLHDKNTDFKEKAKYFENLPQKSRKRIFLELFCHDREEAEKIAPGEHEDFMRHAMKITINMKDLIPKEGQDNFKKWVQEHKEKNDLMEECFNQLKDSTEIEKANFHNVKFKKYFKLIEYMQNRFQTKKAAWKTDPYLEEFYITKTLKDRYLIKEEETYTEEILPKFWEDIKSALREGGVTEGMELKYFLSAIQSGDTGIIFGSSSYLAMLNDLLQCVFYIPQLHNMTIDLKNGIFYVSMPIERKNSIQSTKEIVGQLMYSYSIMGNAIQLSPVNVIIKTESKEQDRLKKVVKDLQGFAIEGETMLNPSPQIISEGSRPRASSLGESMFPQKKTELPKPPSPTDAPASIGNKKSQ